MKFLHLADLHLGKRLRQYDLYADQKFVLDEALDLVKKEKLDAVVVSGDIYDNQTPSGKTTTLLDYFLTRLYDMGVPLLMISGNHDSADKLRFASGILSKNSIHIVTEVSDSLVPVQVDGANFFLLPFTNYQNVNVAFGTDFKDLSSAIKYVISKMPLSSTNPNVLVLHQSVLPSSGALLVGGSEEEPEINSLGEVGGSDAIPVSIFSMFDYVALGHIHKAFDVSNNARYPGALLKYHEDEANNKKSFTVVDASSKHITYEEYPISYIHDVVSLKGLLDDIIKAPGHDEDYLFASLTDKDYLDEPMARLKNRYKFAAGLKYVSIIHPEEQKIYENLDHVSKGTLFSDFFSSVTGETLDDDEKGLIHDEIKNAWGDKE